MSFHLTNFAGEAVRYVGFANYMRLFRTPAFLNSLGVTLRFALMIGIPTLVLGMVLAVLAHERLRGSRFYELAYSMPMAVASAPAAAIWFLIFSPGSGILNFLTGTEYRWLLDPKYALWSVAIVTIWQNTGVNFIFLLTGLRNVPGELLESARIDGANGWQRFFHIMLPVASPQVFFVIFFNITMSFQAFAQVRLLTEGGPIGSTDVLIYSIYRAAFVDGRFETASAQSIVLFLIILIVTTVQLRMERRGVHYR